MPLPPPGWSFVWPYFLAAFAGGYLLGSIPFGLLLAMAAGKGDIRGIGSGNIGATNVLRTGSKGLAAATLLLDGAKGFLAVWLAWRYLPDGAPLAALGAVLGHCYPVWLGFKGGKGVATYVGCLLGLKPVAVVAFGAIWLATAAVSRYSSLSGLVASAAMPPVLWWLGERQMAELFVILTALLWWRHRENIRRLAAGSESRIGKSVGKSA